MSRNPIVRFQEWMSLKRGCVLKSPLTAAIESGDEERFEALLATNCAVDVANVGGWRPLHFAAAKGQHAFVQRLLDLGGTEINSKTSTGETALWLATQRGHEQVCEILLLRSARTDVCNGHNQYPLHIGPSKAKRPLLLVLLLYCLGARNGHLGCVRLLLRKGASVNAADSEGRSALHEAASFGRLDVVRLLLESGAVLDLADRYGVTPMMVAAQNGRLDCLTYLLGKGANPRHADKNGAFAIHLATKLGHLSCVEVLMPLTGTEALFSVCSGPYDEANKCGRGLRTLRENVAKAHGICLLDSRLSVLHLAVQCNRIDMLDYLLKSGVDPNAYVAASECCCCFLFWETALGLACTKCNEEAAKALVNAGARFALSGGIVCDPLARALLNPDCSPQLVRFMVAQGACLRDDELLPIVLGRNDLLPEWMALGGCRVDDYERLEGLVVGIYRKMSYSSTGALMDVLLLFARFLPTALSRRLCDAVKSFRGMGGLPLKRRWKELLQMLDNPKTLLEECRMKTREVLMARQDYNLQLDVLKLDVPPAMRDYLLFR